MKPVTPDAIVGSTAVSVRGEPLGVQRTFLGPEVIAMGLAMTAVFGGLVLRWSNLGKLSLWWDEGFTAWASSLSPAYILRFARSDNQPPVYYLLQHSWDVLFGNSEYALRALSALFGTLSLPVFYLLAKKVLKDSMAAALAIWLFAFSIKQIWYSREARAYEVASFFALVSLYALVLFLERRSVTLFALIVLSVTATLYMHNMMFFYLLALNVTWLIYPSERAWTQRLKEAFLADILVGVLYLPWVFSLFNQVAAVGGNLWWVPRPTAWTLVRTLRDIAGFELEYLSWLPARLLHLSPRAAMVSVVAGLGLLCATMVTGGLWQASKEDRSKYVSLVSYCLLPILIVFVLSQRLLPLYIDRVFTTSSIVVPILFAFPLAVQRAQKGRMLYGFLAIILAATTALSAFGFLRYQEEKGKNSEDWRRATTSVVETPETNRLIVFVPPAGEILFDYYSRMLPAINPAVVKIGLPASYLEQFPPPKARFVDAREIDRLNLAVESRNFSEIDLVLAHDVDPHGLLLNYLNRRFLVREDQGIYGVRILRFLALPHSSDRLK